MRKFTYFLGLSVVSLLAICGCGEDQNQLIYTQTATISVENSKVESNVYSPNEVEITMTMKDFEEELITNKQVLDLMQRVEMVHDPEIANGKYTNDTYETNITIILKDGRVLKRQSEQAYGDPLNPCSMDDVREKFYTTAGLMMNAELAVQLYEDLLAIENIPDIGKIMDGTADNIRKKSAA